MKETETYDFKMLHHQEKFVAISASGVARA